jgi:hypothetical protein
MPSDSWNAGRATILFVATVTADSACSCERVAALETQVAALTDQMHGFANALENERCM